VCSTTIIIDEIPAVFALVAKSTVCATLLSTEKCFERPERKENPAMSATVATASITSAAP
jgi:hypothetical protein